MIDSFDFLRAGHRHVSDSTNLKLTITGLVKTAAAAAGTDMGSLFLLHKAEGALYPYVLFNLPESYLVGCSTVALGTQCCGRAALHKIPWYVEDMWTDPLFIDGRDAAKNSGIRAALSVPVLADNGECLGSLAAHFRDVYRPGQKTVETFQLLCTVIAAAIGRISTGPGEAASSGGLEPCVP